MIAVALSFSFIKLPALQAHADLLALIDLVTKQIGTDPNNAVLFWRRAELYRSHLDWQLAANDYDRAAQLNPKLSAVELGRGKMLFESGQTARAKVELDKFLGDQPDHVDALTTRARVLVKLGQRKAAITDFTRAIDHALKPMPEYFLERAHAQADEGDNDAAVRGLDEGLQRLRFSMPLQLYAIDLEVALKHFQAALRRLDTISKVSERKEKWLARRGEILILAARHGEAQKSFDEALAAIKSLPPRLQATPVMSDLKKRVNDALVSIAARR